MILEDRVAGFGRDKIFVQIIFIKGKLFLTYPLRKVSNDI